MKKRSPYGKCNTCGRNIVWKLDEKSKRFKPHELGTSKVHVCFGGRQPKSGGTDGDTRQRVAYE